jgi:hypothetical protein
MRKAMLLLALFGLVGTLWAADPFVGTWKLNVAKSKASDPSQMPKNEIAKFVAQENGLKYVFDGADVRGKYHLAWSGKYDGKDYPLAGAFWADTSALKKVDTNTVVFVDKKAGKEAMTWHMTVSKDGKTQTVVGKGKDEKGQELTFNLVYDKQ